MKNNNQAKYKIKKTVYFGATVMVIMLSVIMAKSSVKAAWTNPSNNPPNSNLGAPLNTGSQFQAKRGPLSINTDNGLVPFGLWNNGTFVNKGNIWSVGDIYTVGKLTVMHQKNDHEYHMEMGVVYNNDDYRKVDNTGGPWIYAFRVSPDAKSLAGSIGIRVDGSRIKKRFFYDYEGLPGLVVGMGKDKPAPVYAGGFYRLSDRRLKKDIKTVNNALEKIKKVRGVEYKLRNGDVPGIGVVAQEIESYFPALVKKGIGDYKMVDYNGFSGVFIEAIKEQQKQIEKQQQEIEELKKMIMEMKK